MAKNHQILLTLYEKWQKIPGKDRKFFRIYVRGENKGLYTALQKNPHVLTTLPGPIQLAWKGKKKQQLSRTMLKKHMPAITDFFMKHRRGTFENFLNEILEHCSTAEDLRQWLGSL